MVRLGSGVWSMKKESLAKDGMELKFDIMKRDGMLRDTRCGRLATGDWTRVGVNGCAIW